MFVGKGPGKKALLEEDADLDNALSVKKIDRLKNVDKKKAAGVLAALLLLSLLALFLFPRDPKPGSHQREGVNRLFDWITPPKHNKVSVSLYPSGSPHLNYSKTAPLWERIQGVVDAGLLQNYSFEVENGEDFALSNVSVFFVHRDRVFGFFELGDLEPGEKVKKTARDVSLYPDLSFELIGVVLVAEKRSGLNTEPFLSGIDDRAIDIVYPLLSEDRQIVEVVTLELKNQGAS